MNLKVNYCTIRGGGNINVRQIFSQDDVPPILLDKIYVENGYVVSKKNNIAICKTGDCIQWEKNSNGIQVFWRKDAFTTLNRFGSSWYIPFLPSICYKIDWKTYQIPEMMIHPNLRLISKGRLKLITPEGTQIFGPNDGDCFFIKTGDNMRIINREKAYNWFYCNEKGILLGGKLISILCPDPYSSLREIMRSEIKYNHA